MSKGLILLSVVLPTYNRAHCICRMIDSILAQDFKNYELIIVDDGSTDGTVEMLKEKYGDVDIRIVSQENGGVSSARNLGISLAQGEYITFVDSDDYLLDGFFRDIYENILKHKADVYVYAGFSKKRDKLSKVPLFWGDWRYGNGKKMCKHGSEFTKVFCLFDGNSWACSKVFKTSLIRENNLVFEECIAYGEDMLFNLQAYLNSSQVLAISRGYYVYQMSDEGLSGKSLTSQKKVLDLLYACKILEKYGQQYKAFLMLNYTRHLRRWFLLSFFKHNSQTKRYIQDLYLQIDNIPCHWIEKLEAHIAKKSLLCALFVHRILCILWDIRSKAILFCFLVRLPFRSLKRMLRKWDR